MQQLLTPFFFLWLLTCFSCLSDAKKEPNNDSENQFSSQTRGGNHSFDFVDTNQINIRLALIDSLEKVQRYDETLDAVKKLKDYIFQDSTNYYSLIVLLSEKQSFCHLKKRNEEKAIVIIDEIMGRQKEWKYEAHDSDKTSLFISLMTAVASAEDMGRMDHIYDEVKNFAQTDSLNLLAWHMDYKCQVFTQYDDSLSMRTALNFLDKARDYFTAIHSSLLPDTDYYAGYYFKNLNQRDTAIYFFKKFIEFVEGENDAPPYRIEWLADSYHALCEIYYENEKWEKGFEYLGNACTIEYGFSLKDLIFKQDLSRLKYFDNAQYYFENYGDYQIHRNTRDSSFFNAALTSFQRLDTLLQLYREVDFIESLNDDLTFEQRIYGKLIRLLYTRYSIDQNEKWLALSHHYMAKANNRILLPQMQREDIAKTFQIPGDLIQLGESLNKEEQQIYQNPNFMDDVDMLNSSEKREYQLFVKRKNEYDDLLKREYPKYYQSRFKPSYVSLGEVLDFSLRTNIGVLQYHQFKDTIFRLLISQGTPVLDTVHLTKSVRKKIGDYKMLVSRFPTLATQNISGSNRLEKLGLELCQKLLPDLDEIEENNICIIPDGLLSLFPFDALISTERPDVNKPFDLIYIRKEKTIFYALSSSTLLSHQEVLVEKWSKRKLAAFSYNDKMEQKLPFGSIPSSYDECRLIKNYWKRNCAFYPGQKATAANIFKALESVDLAHLSIHAFADASMRNVGKLITRDKNPELPLHRLYHQNYKARCVVLSACDINVGVRVKGDGLYNIARPFFCQGVEALVASDWQVNDKKSSLVMSQFYLYLHDDNNLVSSLHRAKNNYLDDKSQPLHPYFWAVFRLTI